MVSTLGLTRSNGSVSHAGNTSTSLGPRKTRRSWTTRSASVEVGLDGLQAVVAGGAATDLELDAPHGQVELVMDDDELS